MRRAPARPCVRACFVRRWYTVPKDLKLHTSHCTLHTSQFALALHTPHFISSRLIWSLLTSSQLFSSHLISSLLICHLSSSQLLNLSTAQPFSSHRSSPQLILALLHVTKLVLLPERSLLHTKVNGQRSFCTQKFEIQVRLHGKAFTHRKLLHMRSLYTQHAFTQRSFTHSNFLHTASWYTQKVFTQRAFTHSRLLHTAHFYTKFLHTAFFYTEKLLHTAAFTQRIFYTQQAFTQTSL